MSLTSDGEKLFQYALQRERLEQTLRHDLKMQPDTISGDVTVGEQLHLWRISIVTTSY